MVKQKIIVAAMVAGSVWVGGARAQKPPLLAEKDVAALANELSGETAKRNLEEITKFHRQRGSKGFHSAAELVAGRLLAYGLSDVAILQFPADGKIFYGTQRSRPAWDAEFAELWEQGAVGGGCVKAPIKIDPRADENTKKYKKWLNEDCDFLLGDTDRLASYEAEPVVLAEDSESADVTTELVDVGEGTKESDYAGKDVKGKIVLVSAQPGAVQDLAVGKFGAVGIVSYAQNQKTAWSAENQDAIRWGHLDTFSPNKTLAFMVSLKTAKGMREELAKGNWIRLHAAVKAGQHAGNYEVVTATIPGADAKLKYEEIAFSCHLDHQRPGANDNASGCVTILEVARTLNKLINEGKLARPARTIRFIFPPEIEGTIALLNAKASAFMATDFSQAEGPGVFITSRAPLPPQESAVYISGPELAKRIKAVVHMDMVGGGPETKAVFHVTRGPMSLPSFVHDVAWAFAEWVNEESYNFAAGLKSEYPMIAPEGGKEPLRAEYSAYTMGSDHDVYQDSSFGIPAIYLNDWPDRYIHTNLDTAANIDATKLKRVAFIGAASGYFLANFSVYDVAATDRAIATGRLLRTAPLIERKADPLPKDLYVIPSNSIRYEHGVLNSIDVFGPGLGQELWTDWARTLDDLIGLKGSGYEAKGDGKIIFHRHKEPKGPLAVFGYDYFAEHAKEAGVEKPKLLSYEGLWGSGEEYAYEVLNFANGKRNAQEIRDAVSAEYGPVPLEMVVEYLKALEKIGVVEEVK